MAGITIPTVTEAVTEALEAGKTLMEFSTTDIGVKLLEVTHDHDSALPAGHPYVLHWTDYVVNDWLEAYSNLSVATARLAALIRCTELNDHDDSGGGFFKQDPAMFTAVAEAFWGLTIDPPPSA